MHPPTCEDQNPRRRPRVLIVGLGNLLLQDDGVGVHAVRALRHRVPRGVRAVEVGTAVLDALHLFEWADRILAIDAMQAGGDPGTIYRFGVDDVAAPSVTTSLHEMALHSALRFLKRGRQPEIAVLGIEPERIDTGMDLSPTVQRALPHIVEAAAGITTRWRS